MDGEVVVLSFHFLKPRVISSKEIWWWRGDDSVADVFFILDKYNFWREDKGNFLISTVPSNNEFPKGVKISFPNKFLRGLIVNGVPWACERWARLWEIRHLSMSSGHLLFPTGLQEGMRRYCSNVWRCLLVFRDTWYH